MNQHNAPRGRILALLNSARNKLASIDPYYDTPMVRQMLLESARYYLGRAWAEMYKAPASTRRRWRCGR
jgi:hypothetical protein